MIAVPLALVGVSRTRIASSILSSVSAGVCHHQPVRDARRLPGPVSGDFVHTLPTIAGISMPQKDFVPGASPSASSNIVPGVRQQRVARDAGEFGGSSCVGDLGVATATGRIRRSHGRRNAAPAPPILHRRTRRSWNSGPAMARPNGYSQSTLPRYAVRRANPRHLHHGGVRATIVHHTVVPGIMMSGEQHLTVQA